MRTLLRGTVSGLIALFAFASVANASATVDLFFTGKNGAQIGPTTAITAAMSDLVTVSVVLTSGPLSVASFGVTVDYADLLPDFTFAGFAAPGSMPGDLPLNPFMFSFGSPGNTGSSVGLFSAGGFTALSSGNSFLAGTLRFHKQTQGSGTFSLAPSVAGGGFINNGNFTDVASTSAFNGATISSTVPEPTTAALMALGLGTLALIGKRR